MESRYENLKAVKESGRKLNGEYQAVTDKDDEKVKIQYDELVQQLDEDELLFAKCWEKNLGDYATEIENRTTLKHYSYGPIPSWFKHYGFFAIKVHDLIKHKSPNSLVCILGNKHKQKRYPKV